MADNAQLPLLGAIVCCTSVPPEQRTEIASVAEQMGAVHKYDLTSDVTHLIVGDYDTPKYKFVAKARPDVKVLLPSWIEAVRASWLEGGSTDVEAAEIQHTLPTYHGLKICATGFFDLDYRKQLEDEIRRAGGQYFANLTRDITHLIVKKPGSEKYEFARTNGIKTISIEWHQQSLERGMILEESLFDPLLPAAERGQGAWLRKTASTTSLGKRPRENEASSQNARKLRRTASAKFETHNDSLWTDIVSAEVKTEPLAGDAWNASARFTERGVRTTDVTIGGSGHLEGKPPIHRSEDEKHALKRSQSLGNLESLLWKPPQREALFQDKHFFLQNFDEKRAAILVKHLISHGAGLISTPSEVPSSDAYLLVPHTTRKVDVHRGILGDRPPLVVTDLWIERCLHQKKLVPPHEHITSMPFEHFPITGFGNLKVCSTGFQGIDLLHASKVVKLMGGTYEEYFTEKSTVLVCNIVVPGHEKLCHAQLWAVPAVNPTWLWDCVRQKKLLPFDDYLVQQVSILEGNSTLKPKAGEVVAKPNNGPKPGLRANPMQSSSKRPLTNETFKQPKRRPKESKSAEGLGKSFLESSFPDDAGPPSLRSSRKSSRDQSQEGPNRDFAPPQAPGQQRPPLHEVSPNSSPSKGRASDQPRPQPITSPSKANPQLPEIKAINNDDNDDDTLGPAISSLLSRHQAARSSNTTITATTAKPHYSSPPSQPSPPRRRHRQLLGRAPSNPSSHTINLSRASSIDTLNTDGLGTPLEPPTTTTTTNTHRAYDLSSMKPQYPTNPNTTTTTTIVGATVAARAAEKQQQQHAPLPPLYDHHDEHDPDRPSTEHLQMTQLGYEDPDVAAWRERVAAKMAAGGKSSARTENDSTTAAAAAVVEQAGRGWGEGDESIATATVVTTKGKGKGGGRGGAAGLGIATRTRLASAGR